MNVIELEQDLNFKIDVDAIFEEGFIMLNTDLKPEDLTQALDNILSREEMNINNDEIIHLYLRSIAEDKISYFDVLDYLFDEEEINGDLTTKPINNVLNYERIKKALVGLGGFETLFKLLGYKIISLFDTNAIVDNDVDLELLDDFTYGSRHYIITHYQDGLIVDKVDNIHLTDEYSILNYIRAAFNIKDIYLVDNPLTNQKFTNIPKVSKTIEKYAFEKKN